MLLWWIECLSGILVPVKRLTRAIESEVRSQALHVPQDTLDAIEESISRLESSLKLDAGFIDRLLDEDDWSFVIKCHAIAEAVVSTLLSTHLNSPKLQAPLSELDIGHPKYGKIALTKALELTTPFDRRFMVELSKLRNQLAHRIDYISFKFEQHVETLDKQQTDNFVNAFGYCYLDENEKGKAYVSNRSAVLEQPKETILKSLRLLLAIATLQMETDKHVQTIAKHKTELADMYSSMTKLGDTSGEPDNDS